MIDWSRANQLLYNPKTPSTELQQLIDAVGSLKGIDNHFLIATSGSSGSLKWTALAKEAVLLSAEAVNRHLQSQRHDIWLNPLPLFHVGGLGIQARGLLSGAKVVPCHFDQGKWQPQQFLEQLSASKATLTALVPAQLFDLHQAAPPCSLRALIVGGGKLDEALYLKTVARGWPLLPSYGLTECSSQVATAELDSWKAGAFPLLHPLEHVALRVDAEGCLNIRSRSLLTGYVEIAETASRFWNPVQRGWLQTHDQAELLEGKIASLHRGDQMIKIGGESVDLHRLETILAEVKGAACVVGDAVLLPMPHERLGLAIHLVAEGQCAQLEQLVVEFDARVFPYERIRKVHRVPCIPRSPLQKLLKPELMLLLSAICDL